MGLLTPPLLPVKAVIRLAEVIRDQAERELHDPAAVRRQLEEAEEAQSSGQMSREELAEVESDAIDRLYSPSGDASSRAPAHEDGSGSTRLDDEQPAPARTLASLPRRRPGNPAAATTRKPSGAPAAPRSRPHRRPGCPGRTAPDRRADRETARRHHQGRASRRRLGSQGRGRRVPAHPLLDRPPRHLRHRTGHERRTDLIPPSPALHARVKQGQVSGSAPANLTS
jgi:Gas vesicle protein G